MIVRKGQRLGSILHERVEPGRTVEPEVVPVPEPAVEPHSVPPQQPVEPEQSSEIDRLRADAAELGIVVDRRWGAARLQQEIDKRLEASDGDDA